MRKQKKEKLEGLSVLERAEVDSSAVMDLQRSAQGFFQRNFEKILR